MTRLKEIISNTDTVSLKKWILDYANKNPEFKQELLKKFDPSIIEEEAIKDYRGLIRAAFINNPVHMGNRYQGYEHYGFDAEDVRGDLEEIIKDVDYFIKYNNLKTAVQICQWFIEIIPEEWDPNFDYDGDVQVMYDEAIDKLEEMLKENLLSVSAKKELFNWFRKESANNEKHEYVGLNTYLDVLQSYFMSSEEIVAENLNLIDEKIKNTQDAWNKERLILQKIELLKELNRTDEMRLMIDAHLKIPNVRKLRLKELMIEKEYDNALKLIDQGIEIAKNQGHGGTVIEWKDIQLDIFIKQHDLPNILVLVEELLYDGRDYKKYYNILKSETSKNNWPETVDRILENLNSSKTYWGFNHFRADVLIEHEKWEELFRQCKTAGVEYLENYEKYFRPQFDEELYASYLKFIEQQATITNQEAYENVGRMLKRLKKFNGGKIKVNELIAEYRLKYKRRRNMMKVLNEIDWD